MDATGDGTNSLEGPISIAVDSAGNVYVAGAVSDNVFMIPAAGGTPVLIIDATGDGTNVLEDPSQIAIDSADNLYVSGFTTTTSS